MASSFPLNPVSIVAMDRGYNDYALFGKWTEEGIYFVTRIKDNAAYQVLEEGPLPGNRNLLADQLIQFTGEQAKKDCPDPLRRVMVWDAKNERETGLLTNLLGFGYTTIAAICARHVAESREVSVVANLAPVHHLLKLDRECYQSSDRRLPRRRDLHGKPFCFHYTTEQ